MISTPLEDHGSSTPVMALSTDPKLTSKSKMPLTDIINVELSNVISSFLSALTYNSKARTLHPFRKMPLHTKKNKKKRRWTDKSSLQTLTMTRSTFGKKDVSSPVLNAQSSSTE